MSFCLHLINWYAFLLNLFLKKTYFFIRTELRILKKSSIAEFLYVLSQCKTRVVYFCSLLLIFLRFFIISKGDKYTLMGTRIHSFYFERDLTTQILFILIFLLYHILERYILVIKKYENLILYVVQIIVLFMITKRIKMNYHKHQQHPQHSN